MYTSLTFSFLTKNLLSLYLNGTSLTANKKEIRSTIYVVFSFRLISYRTFHQTNLKPFGLFMFFAEQFFSRSFGNFFFFHVYRIVSTWFWFAAFGNSFTRNR